LVLKGVLMSIENRIGGQRVTGILLGVVLALALVVLTWLVVFPRAFRRNRDRMLTVGAFRKFLMRYNNMTRDISGTERSSWGLLTHIGRRSGRTYQTSLGTCSYRDGFLLPLGYGPHTDWYRNLMASGAGKLTWKGRTYQVERPELISGSEPMQAWRRRDRVLLRLAGMHDFVWLHQSEEQSQATASKEHAAQWPHGFDPFPAASAD
jgi:deazaflavin-dependent oxidoreductase (nitroreductase family)